MDFHKLRQIIKEASWEDTPAGKKLAQAKTDYAKHVSDNLGEVPPQMGSVNARRNPKTGKVEWVKESKESMPCNKPTRSTSAGKKMMVKACEGGQEKIVHFGAKGYGHNYSPAARKSFRARHKCGETKSKLGAQYWACRKLWAGPKGSKKSCPPGRKCKY
jgi:hypothetical protein